MGTLGERIAQARLAKGLTQLQLAEKLGVSRVAVTQWETDTHSPVARLDQLAKELGIAFDWLRTGNGPMRAAPPQDASLGLADQDMSKARPINYPDNKTRDLPVVGTAMGGPNGYFEMQGSIIEHVWRPPHLTAVTHAFALYVAGHSMSPRYDEGELIYCRPGKHPRPGNYVVIEMHQESDGAPIMATIGRYKRQAGGGIEIEKLNPPSVQKVPSAKIKRIHIIAGTGEA